jgi:tripartite-type tricarboxylate transporter receptor subunit TctC
MMQLTKRAVMAVMPALLVAAISDAYAAASPPSAEAAAYPARPIRMMVGFPPGGGNDAIARLVSPKLAEKFGHNVVVDNRPGAGGNLAALLLTQAPADGHTVLVASSSHPIQGLLKKNLPYDPIKDFSSVAQMVVYRSLLVVHPSVQATTVKEVIALAKAKPGHLNFASSGNGTGSHLAAELFKVSAGVDITHVPYKGGAQAAVDLIAGRTDMMFSPLVPVLAHIKAGRLRPVAVTSQNRSRILPDLPTISEAGVTDFEFVSWYGVMAPARTPRAIRAKLNAAMNQAMRLPDVSARVHAEDMDLVDGTPEQFDKVREAMVVKWERIVKLTGIEAN